MILGSVALSYNGIFGYTAAGAMVAGTFIIKEKNGHSFIGFCVCVIMKK